MGVIVSFFANTGRTDDPDPTTGLTSRDRYLVTSSWAEVRKNPTGNGVELLMLFFTKYPKYMQLFPFRDVPMNQLRENKRFQAHCVSVVYGLSSIIDLLNNTDLLVAALKKVGETHTSRGADKQSFEDLNVTVIELFSTFMTKDQVEAWKKTLNVAFSVVVSGLGTQ